MMKKNELYIDGCAYGLVKDHTNDFDIYNHFKNAVHFFDGSIQHTDVYGNKLYLTRENGKWVPTTETTAIPYNYPKIVEPDSDQLVNIFLLENKRKFFAYPVKEWGKNDADVISSSNAEFYSELISFCLENRYKYLGLLDTMFQDYDPISNYDSYEKRQDTHGDETFTHTPKLDNVEGHTKTTVKPVLTQTETTPDTAGIETEHYVTTYDSDSSTRLSDRTVQKGGTTTTVKAVTGGDGVNETNFSSEKYQDKRTQSDDGYVLERHGNIGVTSTQDMLEQERNIRRYSILKEFCKDLGNYVCLSVY